MRRELKNERNLYLQNEALTHVCGSTAENEVETATHSTAATTAPDDGTHSDDASASQKVYILCVL